MLKPGDPIFDLVPSQDRLVAEVNVQPNDIDVVHPGLQAEVRLPAFKQRLVPYLHGRVIEAICEHLEAVTAGQIRRLLINVPPGTAKSLLASVFWPAWAAP